jgi:alkylation response protein AidB-like acyl-CoA dehydrogenase
MDFTISDEVKSVQQLAAQIMGDFTEVDKLKAIEQQDDVFDEKLWAALAEAAWAWAFSPSPFSVKKLAVPSLRSP